MHHITLDALNKSPATGIAANWSHFLSMPDSTKTPVLLILAVAILIVIVLSRGMVRGRK